jgi:hypothetical protein
VNGTKITTLLDNTTPIKNKITVQKYRDPSKQNNETGAKHYITKIQK